MLTIKKLNVSIGKINILRDISIEVHNRKFIGLIGRNGAGKTTLMKTIIGLLSHQGGSIYFEKQVLNKTMQPFLRARLGIGYMPEDRRLIPDLSVEENILINAWATQNTQFREKLNYIYNMIPEVQEFSNRKALFLSGGQQKLVSLARALMGGSKLLLLDEPFEGVAPALAQRLVELIINLKKTGISVILSESDLTHSEKILDYIYMIDRGEIIQPKTL